MRQPGMCCHGAPVPWDEHNPAPLAQPERAGGTRESPRSTARAFPLPPLVSKSALCMRPLLWYYSYHQLPILCCQLTPLGAVGWVWSRFLLAGYSRCLYFSSFFKLSPACRVNSCLARQSFWASQMFSPWAAGIGTIRPVAGTCVDLVAV